MLDMLTQTCVKKKKEKKRGLSFFFIIFASTFECCEMIHAV